MLQFSPDFRRRWVAGGAGSSTEAWRAALAGREERRDARGVARGDDLGDVVRPAPGPRPRTRGGGLGRGFGRPHPANSPPVGGCVSRPAGRRAGGAETREVNGGRLDLSLRW